MLFVAMDISSPDDRSKNGSRPFSLTSASRGKTGLFKFPCYAVVRSSGQRHRSRICSTGRVHCETNLSNSLIISLSNQHTATHGRAMP